MAAEKLEADDALSFYDIKRVYKLFWIQPGFQRIVALKYGH